MSLLTAILKQLSSIRVAINGLPKVYIVHDDPDTYPMSPDTDYTGQMTVENGYGSSARNLYDGNIEFSIGGNYTATLPKKPINVKLKNSGGSTISSDVLDLQPPSEEYRLLAHYDDPLLGIRNWIMFQMGRSSVDMTSKFAFVELWEEGDYQGLYMLAQRVKRGSALRKSVLTAMPGGGTPDEGGMAWEIANDVEVDDVYINTSLYGVNLKWNYPNKENVSPAHVSYGEDLFADMETGISTGDLSMIDVPSFARMHVIHALMLNKDAYSGSTYFYKPVDGKITACCMWDGTLSLASPLPDLASQPVWQDPEYLPFLNPGGTWNAPLLGIQEYKDAYKAAFAELKPKYIDVLQEARGVYEWLKDSGAYERNAAIWDYFGTPMTPAYMDGQMDNLEDFALTRLDYLQTQVDAL